MVQAEVHEITANTRGGAAPTIRLRQITKQFGNQAGEAAMRGITLDIFEKELLVLLGPSGCGKSTTLNILAGLEEPSSGELYFGDILMNRVPAEERDVSMVFQSIALYPHMDVLDNITFTLKLRKVPKGVINERVATISRMLGMERYLQRKLDELSGGERQRVAIAKALVKRPQLFLLDEPFSSLDADMRRQLRTELVRIHHELETTMLFVTHDQEEAMSVADRIAVMRNGELVQVGTPLDIYNTPVNLWTSRFVGTHPINVLEIALDSNRPQVRLEGRSQLVLPMDAELHARLYSLASSGEVIAGIRPEYVELTPADGASGALRGEVFTRQVLGTSILYDVRTDHGHTTSVTSTQDRLNLGTTVGVTLPWERAFFFDKKTEQRIAV
ncbi:MAG: ABC transporter ATP-binding protein [Chloroflexota bacterium]|nr:ABC transporter ATP-binding protein [Chloroflexota bacterium]